MRWNAQIYLERVVERFGRKGNVKSYVTYGEQVKDDLIIC